MTRAAPVHRIEVSPKPGLGDPVAESLKRDAGALGIAIGAARSAHVYLVQAPLTPAQLQAVRTRLLTDPVAEDSVVGASPVPRAGRVIEVHPLPGVMDPVAESVEMAIADLTGVRARVSTGWRYDLVGPDGAPLASDDADRLATRLLANPVIHRVHRAPWTPDAFSQGRAHDQPVRRIPLRSLTDDQLTRLAREAHLFLSLEEMRTIRSEYARLGREPTDIELETLAQTWSEHCVHKTLKSTIRYVPAGTDGQTPSSPLHDPIHWTGRPNHDAHPDGSITIHNLLKSTVAAATYELIGDGLDWTLSVFVDNAGVIAFDDRHAVCVKVETHNHPSAIEPYGGAATGIGGCIRDVIGTGLGARPVANTDVFCVALPGGFTTESTGNTARDRNRGSALPPGCLHPRRILTQVVAGVRDYGNRMGIPTVSGGVAFDNRYVGNPLVFCGCVGVMPRDKVRGKVQSGDLIVALGGRTGRDGIHGATFSSAELTDTHADEFAHAVQIGNAITEKRVLDAIMRARDGSAPLYTSLTDCGAGGFSSAVGEMARQTGATVHLDRAPLKYAGLSYTEIWISEAQERMVLAVPARNLEPLRRICDEEGVELAVLGTFAPPPPHSGSSPDNPDLALYFHDQEVGRLSMHFLHEGIPTPHREAIWPPPVSSSAPIPRSPDRSIPPSIPDALLALLAHPDIASKHWIIRQYDHEVRGSTILRPLVGPDGRGPSDASVIQPVAGSRRALAISQGLQTGIGDPALGGDPYLMALAAVDECVRNLVCVGADPDRIAILDNFCWPSCDRPHHLGALVRAAEGCYDAAKAYRTPFVSGKDSLNNQFTTTDGRTIEIPYTLLITGIGIVPDAAGCVSMDAKEPGNVLVLVGATMGAMGGSHFQQLFGAPVAGASAGVPRTDLAAGPAAARAVAGLIARGLVRAAHDCSDGGVLTAIAEMLIAGSTPSAPIGAAVDLDAVGAELAPVGAAFAEAPSRYVLEVRQRDLRAMRELLGGVPHAVVGPLDGTGRLSVTGAGDPIGVERLRGAWLGPLDW